MSNDKTVSSQVDEFFKNYATTTFGPLNHCLICKSPIYNQNVYCSDSCAENHEKNTRDLLLLLPN